MATGLVLKNTCFPLRSLQTKHSRSPESSETWEAAGASVEPDLPQVDLDDDVGDSIEHKLHILGVCGTSEVSVDLLGVLSFI